MNRLYTRAMDASTLVLNPAPILFYMLGGFIGFCIAALTCERVHQWLLGPRPEFFSVEYSMAAGPLPGFVKKPCVGILVVFSLVAVLNIRKHARIHPSEIVEQRALAGGPESYAIALTERVDLSRYYMPSSRYGRGRISENRTLYVKFRDGRVWSPKDSELYVPDVTPLATAISALSRATITYPEEIEGLPSEGFERRQLAGIAALFAVTAVMLFLLKRALKRDAK